MVTTLISIIIIGLILLALLLAWGMARSADDRGEEEEGQDLEDDHD